jgi:hypothetical protein
MSSKLGRRLSSCRAVSVRVEVAAAVAALEVEDRVAVLGVDAEAVVLTAARAGQPIGV